MEKKKVLIVDDDQFLLDMYAMKFGEENFEVTVSPRSQDALDKLEGGFVPDIMLIDIVMPDMDGFELIGQIREKRLAKKSTIIILSNLGQQEDIDKGMRLGVQGYIVKASCTPTEVLQKVTEIMQMHERQGGKA
ncbi:MAG: response regulator [Candidatus Vogelbacteria bacterium]|nr:response regulator [Candidatus Vogelbacteria bacterium]